MCLWLVKMTCVHQLVLVNTKLSDNPHKPEAHHFTLAVHILKSARMLEEPLDSCCQYVESFDENPNCAPSWGRKGGSHFQVDMLPRMQRRGDQVLSAACRATNSKSSPTLKPPQSAS